MNRHGARSTRRASQRGQSFMIVAIFVALILLAVLGIATDYTQVWAHRQMAQGAADAACQAAAADLYFKYLYPTAPTGMSYGWIGSSFDCSSNTSSPPCSYAAANGYSGSAVTVSFPSSLLGVSPIRSEEHTSELQSLRHLV